MRRMPSSAASLLILRGLLRVGICACLCACNEPQSGGQLQAWIAQAASEAASKADSPAPSHTLALANFEAATYLHESSATPFRREHGDDAAADPMRPPQRGPRQALEDFALASLQLVGTLSRGSNHLALISAGGQLYRLRVGDYLGPDFGKIQRISASQLELQQLRRRSDDDHWSEYTVLLTITGEHR